MQTVSALGEKGNASTSKNHTPAISVIVPIYNGQHTLWQCMRSITSQTFTDFEIILVDDGSTDWTSDMCDSLAKLDQRIRVIHQKNKGLSGARNTALDVALGKYIAFIDGDDHVAPQFFEILINMIADGKYDIAISPAIIESADKRKQIPEIRSEIQILNSHDMRMRYGNRDRAIYVRAWGRLFRKEIFDDLRFREGVIYEDMFLFPELYKKDLKIIIGTIPTYYYVQHMGSITRHIKSARDLQSVEAALETFDAFVDVDDEALQGMADKIYAVMRAVQACPNIIREDGKVLFKQYRKEYRKRLQILKKKKLFRKKDVIHFLLLYV